MGVAQGLLQTGVRVGDRVCLVLPNSVEFAVAHFGVLTAGGISVPCDATISEVNLAAVQADCAPRLTLRPGDIARRGWLTAPAALPVPQREPGDVAALMYTTGTTGRPKGVMLTHDTVYAALRSISRFIGYTPLDKEVVVLPLSHNFGLGHLYCNLMNGGEVYTEPGLTRVGRVLRKLRDLPATGFPGTPASIGMLLDRFGDAFVEHAHGLRFMVINSAPLPPERAAQLRLRLPRARILVYYGLTEASRSTFIDLNSTGPDKYASVGRPMAGVVVRLTPEHEVLIRSPALTPGYWNDPARTRQTIREGWLHTGDLGRFDQDGFLYITGRVGDVINVGGYKVNPQEVEDVLTAFPGVTSAGVFGVDCVEAALVCDAALDEQALVAHCRARLEPFKVPTRFHRVDSLPHTDTGKLKRAELSALSTAKARPAFASSIPGALPC
jgi:long-chain acyl-CoA synthetase